MNPRHLPDGWRSLAEQQRALGAAAQACTLEWCAAGLEAALDAAESELVTVSEAADMGGYSEEHLRRLVRAGELPAVQEVPGGRIRLRIRDVPTKPTIRSNGPKTAPSRVAPRSAGRYDPAEDARDIAQAIGGER